MKQCFSILIFAQITSAFLSCNNHSPQDENKKFTSFATIRVQQIPLNSSWTVSDAFKEVKFLQLETTVNSSFGRIDRIIFTKEYILILDWLVAKDIFVFDRTGRFISRFASTGKGPGEFLDPTDFFWDQTSQNLVVLDNARFMHYYELKDGRTQFIKTIEIPKNIEPFEVSQISSGNYLAFICGGTNANLCITIPELTNPEYFFPYLNRNFSVELRNGLNDNNGKLLYRKYANDTIFQITGDNVVPHKIIDFNQTISLESLLQLPMDKQSIDLDERYLVNLYFECDTSFYLKYSKSGKEFFLIRASNGKFYQVSKTNMRNDLFGSESLLCKGIDHITKSFVFTASPLNVLSILKDKSERINSSNRNIIERMNLKETDNTILVLAK